MDPPNDTHYRAVARSAENLVVFLGADVNADGRSGSFQAGSALPDDRDVACHLAKRAELDDGRRSLAEVAQRAIAIHGQPTVFGWLREMLVPEDAVASRVHQGVAEIPAALDAAGFGTHYQLIVTSAYDAAVEAAFAAAGEEFDRAIYKVPPLGSEQPGTFVHLPYDSLPVPIGIGAAGDYTGFPIARDERNMMQMLRTLIVRTNGVVDHPDLYVDWPENFVLSEDDYIGYLSGVAIAQVFPSQILAKLKQANYLFLGFTLADWRLRVFLQRIWGGPTLGRGRKYWAVAAEPDALEEAMCKLAGVELIHSGLTEYVDGLHAFLRSADVQPQS
jgi:hypothetical protein